MSVLVRYGQVPEVGRFNVACDEPLHRDDEVVLRTQRGLELGRMLQNWTPETVADVSTSDRLSQELADLKVVRKANSADHRKHRELRDQCEAEFEAWRERIYEWKLELELIDSERTLDTEQLILYVLNERGPDCTKLSLYAAAGGLGTVTVQPVGSDGIIQLEPVGGCGSGGCGSGGCSH
ncbi:PSP1 C-terminal domain-containing protein [Thalassoroseus pseudoceratinae]|uniref:PSP1 C-terminal domain-containing protein n=1 Tax=Thalassoroseus pseudoceratinae TaxID=2713176 RepID=UPI001423DA3C|nr:PSP1 C-terminal domain-containing protein [Thalassoroseus pseudoceratinae]